ncbi:MAG: hypothetical protein J6R12_00895 [Bacteroidales bacterium]|nr:hypothetical protein [Bacteroidales bacterium]
MKNLFTILLSCLMISLFLSCSMEPEQDFVENEKETFESLKMKVEAMAQEYGVGVSINEKVWRKRLPSIDDIEKDFIRIKELSAATRSNMDSTSANQSYTSVFSNANTNISALENKPRVLKSYNERPIYGSYDKYTYLSDDGCYYDINVTVSWQYGGGSNVRFSATVTEDKFNGTHCEIWNPSYRFSGNSFTASCTIYHYRYSSQFNPSNIFYVHTTYNANTGIGYIEVTA